MRANHKQVKAPSETGGKLQSGKLQTHLDGENGWAR